MYTYHQPAIGINLTNTEPKTRTPFTVALVKVLIEYELSEVLEGSASCSWKELFDALQDVKKEFIAAESSPTIARFHLIEELVEFLYEHKATISFQTAYNGGSEETPMWIESSPCPFVEDEEFSDIYSYQLGPKKLRHIADEAEKFIQFCEEHMSDDLLNELSSFMGFLMVNVSS